jgi:hypothetical protein
VAGYVRYPELASGHVNHALFFASSQVARSHVYPAGASDGDNDPGSGYPPMGTHFQLDPSYMSNARLARYPQWKRAILRAMRDYGFYLSDTTGSPIGSVRFESGLSYTSLGRSDPFVAYARRHHLPHSYDSGVGRTIYEFNLQSGVDWKKLRVVDPCQSRGAC